MLDGLEVIVQCDGVIVVIVPEHGDSLEDMMRALSRLRCVDMNRDGKSEVNGSTILLQDEAPPGKSYDAESDRAELSTPKPRQYNTEN